MTVYSPAINTYVPLATVTLAASSSSVTFIGIPTSNADGNFRDLIMSVSLKDSSATRSMMYVNLNGDSGTNYSYVRMGGNGSTTNSAAGTLAYFYAIQSGQWDTQIWQFNDFSATDKHKVALWRLNDMYTESASESVSAFAGRWANTAAINSITLTSYSGLPWVAGSTFSLYALHG